MRIVAHMLTKQAKTLTDPQQKAALSYLDTTRYPTRNIAMFLLSTKAGLRSKEIAALTWGMICDAEGVLGDHIALNNSASKGKRGGRAIPLNKHLKQALAELHKQAASTAHDSHVITSERSQRVSAQYVTNFFQGLYKALGFAGCSSHSGRRTFITNAARKITLVGGSLRDVQQLAGHSSISTTQRYIESDAGAMKNVVQLI